MTAPVSQEKAGGQWRITFLMPASSTMETLPEPLDPKVRLIEIPRRFMADLFGHLEPDALRRTPGSPGCLDDDSRIQAGRRSGLGPL